MMTTTPTKTNGPQRRALVLSALGLPLLGLAATSLAQASAYPSRAIRLVVGFAPGSNSDTIGRALADQLARRTGQAVVVENKPGAGGNMASEFVASAAPDGYTLLLATGAIATNAALHQNAKFNPMRDLAPVVMVAKTQSVMMVNDKVPARTLAEFVAYAKARPGQVNFGSAGQGASSHFSMEAVAIETGVRMVHVPYRGNSQATLALQSGEIQALSDSTLLAAQSLTSGKVRALAVSGARRSALMPDVPTFTEAGYPRIEGSSFVGALLAPAGTPKEVLDLLNQHVNALLREPEIKTRLVDNGGLELVGGTREALAREMAVAIEKWTLVAQAAGIKPQ